jgi:UbiA prenyltransferase family
MPAQSETVRPPPILRPTASWRDYARLVRLPNVFTAVADIALGWLGAWAAGTPAARWPSFLLLIGASACLYSAGMIWNDFFDIEQDRRERPFRPLPSGRISRASAAMQGVLALLLGLVFAALAGLRMSGLSYRPLIIAGLLVLCILLYDGWLKRTWAGPIAMGSCRFLNVLLGLSVAENFALAGQMYLALVVGLYIVGVTWFARTEARQSNRGSLSAASGVMLVSLILALAAPLCLDRANPSPLFPYLLVGLGFLLGIPISRATADPRPARVQAAVKRSIMGLVVLDAILASALAGTIGLVIIVLVLPALYLGRWIYST